MKNIKYFINECLIQLNIKHIKFNPDPDVTISELYYNSNQLADLIVQQNINLRKTNEAVF